MTKVVTSRERVNYWGQGKDIIDSVSGTSKRVLLQTVKTQMIMQHNAEFHQGLHCF